MQREQGAAQEPVHAHQAQLHAFKLGLLMLSSWVCSLLADAAGGRNNFERGDRGEDDTARDRRALWMIVCVYTSRTDPEPRVYLSVSLLLYFSVSLLRDPLVRGTDHIPGNTKLKLYFQYTPCRELPAL